MRAWFVLLISLLLFKLVTTNTRKNKPIKRNSEPSEPKDEAQHFVANIASQAICKKAQGDCKCTVTKQSEDPVWYRCECNGFFQPPAGTTKDAILVDRIDSRLKELDKGLKLEHLDELVVLCMIPVVLYKDSAFARLTGLKKLELRYCTVGNIETFGPMADTLHTVWKRSSLLTKDFSFDAFRKLTNLKEADFTDSSFAGEQLPCLSPFAYLRNLKHLNFQKTGLKTFKPSDCSESSRVLVQVPKLTLVDNAVSELRTVDLAWARDVYDLNLERCNILKLEAGALAHLQASLGIVQVSSNPLGVPAFFNLTADLSNCTNLLTFEANSLSLNSPALYPALAQLPSSLTTLEIENTEQPPQPDTTAESQPAIAHLNKLSTIRLVNWGFKKFGSGYWSVDARKVTTLFLKHNELESWPHLSQPYPELVNYDVSFNPNLGRFLKTDECTTFFTGLPKLRKFVAVGIGLESICAGLWGRDVVKLREVDLSQNSLTAFPLDAKLFSVAKEVKLSANRIVDPRRLFHDAKQCIPQKQLTLLDLSRNSLTDLPVELATALVKCLPALQKLQLAENQLSTITKDFLVALDEHPSLKELNLARNQINFTCANEPFFKYIAESNSNRRYNLHLPDDRSSVECSAQYDGVLMHSLKGGGLVVLVIVLLGGGFVVYKKRKPLTSLSTLLFHKIRFQRWCPGGQGISVRGDDAFQFHVYPIFHPEDEELSRTVLGPLEKQFGYRVFVPPPLVHQSARGAAFESSSPAALSALTCTQTHDGNETRHECDSLAASSVGGASSVSRLLISRHAAGSGERDEAFDNARATTSSGSDPLLSSQHVLVFLSSNLTRALLNTCDALHDQLVGQLHRAITRKQWAARYGGIEIIQLDSVDWPLLGAPSTTAAASSTSAGAGAPPLELVKQFLLANKGRVREYNEAHLKGLLTALRLQFGDPTSVASARVETPRSTNRSVLDGLHASYYSRKYRPVASHASSTAPSEARPLVSGGGAASELGAPSVLMLPGAGPSGVPRASEQAEDDRLDSVSAILSGTSVVELDRTAPPPAPASSASALLTPHQQRQAGLEGAPAAATAQKHTQVEVDGEAERVGVVVGNLVSVEGERESEAAALAEPEPGPEPGLPLNASASQLLLSFSPDPHPRPSNSETAVVERPNESVRRPSLTDKPFNLDALC